MNHPSYRFAYFGTPAVARDTLTILVESGFVPTLVVTFPDAPRGRGLALLPSPVKEAADERGLAVMTPEKLDAGTIAEIQKYDCDYAIVVAYGKIFPETLIGSFPKGVLNIHYSLLPKYRGATPLEAALLAGESATGVTIQKMASGLDTGDILAQKEIPIAPGETARELRPKLILAGARLLVETLPSFERGTLMPTPQGTSDTPLTRKLKKEDGLLSLDGPDEESWRKYRAYADTIGTYFFEGGKRMKIAKASFTNGRFVVERVIPEGKRETSYQAR